MIAILSVKANHLAYIEPRWFGSQIFADCQQKVLFTKHDTNGRNKRERTTRRDIRVYIKVFSWLLDFISTTSIQDESRQNQIISVKEKVSLGTQ